MIILFFSLCLIGVMVFCDGVFQQCFVVFEDGWIFKGFLFEVDLSGYFVLLGIVDLYGSVFECYFVLCFGDVIFLDIVLCVMDFDVVVNGVIIGWILQAWSWEGGNCVLDWVEVLLCVFDVYGCCVLIDLWVQICCEMYIVDMQDWLLVVVWWYWVDFVFFVNMLDEVGFLVEVDFVWLV